MKIYYFLTTSSESHCLVLQILFFLTSYSYMFLLTYARLIKTCKHVCMQISLVLLIIEVDEGTVEVLDSLLKKASDYTIVMGIVNR